MLYPLIIQTVANEHLAEIRRHAELDRRIRQARAGNRPASQARKTGRFTRLVTLRGA